MIVLQQFIQEIDCFIRDISLIFRSDESCPWFPGIPRYGMINNAVKLWLAQVPSKKFVILWIKTNVVLVNVGIQLVGSQNLGDFDKLIVVVVSVEKWFFTEYLQMQMTRCFPNMLTSTHH